MDINYECYKVFNMVVKYQSITAAAKAMDLTQPTVTHYIQKLEENLHCVLFLRGKKGVTLTPEGEIIYHYIDIACENMMRAEKELERYRKNESGELAIGAKLSVQKLIELGVGEPHDRAGVSAGRTDRLFFGG